MCIVVQLEDSPPVACIRLQVFVLENGGSVAPNEAFPPSDVGELVPGLYGTGKTLYQPPTARHCLGQIRICITHTKSHRSNASQRSWNKHVMYPFMVSTMGPKLGAPLIKLFRECTIWVKLRLEGFLEC